MDRDPFVLVSLCGLVRRPDLKRPVEASTEQGPRPLGALDPGASGTGPQDPRYGLFDAADGVWLGDESGPNTYGDLQFARAAATVFSERLGTLIEVREYDPTPKRVRDRVTPMMSGLEAIQRLEERR